MLLALPIDPLLPDVVSAIEQSNALVLEAPPGAGKTTRVPRALYDAGFAGRGEILVLEPRRLAARVAAARVAEELDEPVGKTVGYAMRFDSIGGPDTSIRFVTEGVLARRMLQTPRLDGVALVLLDEIHERHLASDLALAWVRRLQLTTRPDLRVVAMSATLDPGPLAEFLGNAPVLAARGVPFDVAIEYEPKPDNRPLEAKVASAARRLVREGLDGDVLVFLPGAAEIRRSAAALADLARAEDLEIAPLHGDLPAAEQLGAVRPAPGGRRKIVLATNVAESSITIPGIAAVVDTGLARVAGHSPWSGLPTLATAKVSKASAAQRAGRAGRTRAGRVLRLYTRFDFESRPERDVAEIQRADLAETVLTLHGAGVDDVRSFGWFEPPPAAALEAAGVLLLRLGAVDRAGRMTALGRRLLRFPAHPRLARLVVEAESRGAGREAAACAALLSERDVRLEARTRLRGLDAAARRAAAVSSSDLTEMLDRLAAGEGLDPQAARAVRRAERQLLGSLGRDAPSAPAESTDEALRISLLAAFPDRVARRRAPGSREFVLAAGGSARLAESSAVDAELIVAVDAEMRSEAERAGSGVVIRLASAIEPEWLAALFPDEIVASDDLVWNEAAGRVDRRIRTLYGQVVLEERVEPAPPSAETARLLAEAARASGRADFKDREALAQFRARVALAAAEFPSAGFPVLDEAAVRSALEEACAGRRSLAELGKVSLVEVVRGRLSAAQRALLEREVPERIRLRAGRSVAVHYEPGKPPWVASRLQDFFGMTETPALCAGHVRLTVHLLAPNGRPVQVTQDLASFWERHYPSLRRELARRYPRHAWPERP